MRAEGRVTKGCEQRLHGTDVIMQAEPQPLQLQFGAEGGPCLESRLARCEPPPQTQLEALEARFLEWSLLGDMVLTLRT